MIRDLDDIEDLYKNGFYGFDPEGFFYIPPAPKWVKYLRSKGIEVNMGAWGVFRGYQNDNSSL